MTQTQTKPSTMWWSDNPGIFSIEIDDVWDEVEPFIVKSLKYTDGKYLPEDIKKCLKDREMQLWVDGDPIHLAAITQIINYPQQTRLSIMFAGGKGIVHQWERYILPLAEWGRGKGCEKIEIYGRAGWEKVLPFKKIHTVLAYEI